MEDVRAGDTVMISDGAGGTTTKRVGTVTVEGGGVVTYDLTLANPQASYFANGHVTPQKVLQ